MDKTAIHGFLGKIHEIHRAMQELRKKYGMDITLRSYLAKNFNGLTPDHLYNELDIDPRVMTVENLLTSDDDTRWLVPEVIRDAIRIGYTEEPIWPYLIIADEPIGQPSVRAPKIEISENAIEEVAEGATIPKGAITYSDKTVNTVKRGVGIDVTYEVIRFTSLNLLNIYLQDVGVRLGAQVTAQAIDTLINGDQDDGSEAAAVIGVDDTEEGLVYKDLLRAWVRMSRVQSLPDSILAPEDICLLLLQMEEFKKRYQGQSDLTARLMRPLPSEQNIFPTSSVPASKLLMNSKSRSMVKVTVEPLMVEADKIIARQITETVASTIFAFVTLHRVGRVILDTTVAYSGNGWPTWFAPIE